MGRSEAERGWNEKSTREWSLALFVGSAMLYACRATLPLAMSQVAQELDWNKSWSGTVLSAFFWGYAISQVFVGNLADEYGGEELVLLSSLCWSVLTIATPLLFDLASLSSHTLLFSIILRVILGVAQSFYMPCMASLCSQNLAAKEKGKIFGLCLAGTHVGMVVAGGLGSVVVDSLGWRALFHLVGGISLIWVTVYHTLLSSYRKSSPIHTPKVLSSSQVPWSTLLSHPSFWAAAVAHFSGTNAYMIMFNWLPSFFHEVYPQVNPLYYNVLPGLCIVFTSLVSPLLCQLLHSRGYSLTVSRKALEGSSLIAMAICLSLLSPSSPFPLTLLLFALAMSARGLHHGGVSVNPTDFAPNHTGAVFGVFNSFGSITGFIGVFVAGHILEQTHEDWSAVFLLSAIQCIIGCVIYSLFGTAQPII